MAACPSCGEPVGDGARFCAACGAALDQLDVGREERKVVSILFIDLVGSTAAADGSDPEEIRDVLRAYHAHVKADLERFGATVEKFIGDAVMAVFGAPRAHADDAERAVRAGLRALETVRSLPGVKGGSLSARAAVATGEAVISVDANARTGEALAMGDVVNTAARLQSAAPEQGLVVDEATMRATRRTLSYRSLEPLVARGKAQPLVAYLAVGDVGAEEAPGRGSTPLVGRHLELSELLATWDRVQDQRRPYLVTVVGEAGAGKSRLAREFAAGVGSRVVIGRCVPYEQSEVYGAFAQQLKKLAGIRENERPESSAAKVSALVDRLLPQPERAEVRRHVALLLGPVPDQPVITEQTSLLYSFRRLVEATALERPTVFVFEDVHWAEPAEYELIRYLAGYVRDVPAMFVALARPELLEAHPDWSSGLTSYSALALEPLGDEAARSIVSAFTGDAVPAEVVDRLVETAAGNPLFLEELATAVVEGSGSMVELPTNVRAAIASRVDALPADARTALLAGAVVGRTFWQGAVDAATNLSDARGALDVLEQRDLIRHQPTSDVPDDVEFRFKHALIRDVCYATLPRRDRASAHAAVAGYLEQRVGDNDELAWLLAHHYEQAGDAAPAIAYLVVAAERAAAAFGASETLGLLDRAARLAVDETTKLKLRLARGRALTRFEDFDPGYDTLGPLLSVLDGDDLLEALVDHARCCHWTERTSEVIEHSQRAVELANELGRRDTAPAALGRLSHGYAMRGEQGDLAHAIEIGEDALSSWGRGDRIEDKAEHEYLLGHQHYWAGDSSRALTLARQARETATDDPASAEARLRGTGMEGVLLAQLGHYREALVKFSDALTLAEDMGRPRRVLLNYSTLAFRELFDLAESRQRSEWVLDGLARSSFHMPWMNAEADLLHVEVLAGEWGPALLRWERMYPEILETSAWERWLLGTKLEIFRAEIALHTDGGETAADWATRALASTRRAGRVKYQAAAHDVLARALVLLGRTDDARAESASAVAMADKLGNPHGRLLAHAHAAEILRGIGDDAAAHHHLIAEQVSGQVAADLPADLAERYLAGAANASSPNR